MKQGSPEWQEARRSMIGGSEVAALFDDPVTGKGVHPWLSALELWRRKTGRSKPPNATITDTPELYWGRLLEPVVCQGYADLTGRELTAGVTMRRHPRVACMGANTDRTIVAFDERGPGVLEAKTSGWSTRAAWYEDDELRPPLYIEIQVQHYLACEVGDEDDPITWGSVAVYFKGERQPLHYVDLDRHERMIGAIEQRCEEWWDRHIIHDEEPAPDGSDSAREAFAALHPRDDGSLVKLPYQLEASIAMIDMGRRLIRQHGTVVAECKSILSAAMKDSTEGWCPNGRRVTFKVGADGVRRLRIPKGDRKKRPRGMMPAEIDDTTFARALKVEALVTGQA